MLSPHNRGYTALNNAPHLYDCLYYNESLEMNVNESEIHLVTHHRYHHLFPTPVRKHP